MDGPVGSTSHFTNGGVDLVVFAEVTKTIQFHGETVFEFAPACEIVVVVHASNSIGEISLVRPRVFHAGTRRTSSDGKPVSPLLPSSGSVAMDCLVKKVSRESSEEEIAQYYVSAIYKADFSEIPHPPNVAEGLRSVHSAPDALVVGDPGAVKDPTGLRILHLE